MSLIRKNFHPHLALIGANIIYGLNYSIAKILMPDYIKPLGLVALRAIVATSLFWIFSLFRPQEKVERKDLIYMFSFFLFGVFFNQVFFLAGLNRTTPINASLLMLINPILAIVFGMMILKEKITGRRVAGVITGLAGTALLIIAGAGFRVEGGSLTGNVFILINAASWALFIVTIKKMTDKYSNVTVMKWVFLFGVTPNILIGHNQLLDVNFMVLPASIILGMIYVTFFTTFVGYNLNTYGLKYVSPTVVSTYVYLQPVIAAIVSMILGQDTLSWVKGASAAMVFIGVYLVSSKSKKQLLPGKSLIGKSN